ncbi:MAG: hypothetical protein ACREIR_06235 [Geminicoccaceae bacterium]
MPSPEDRVGAEHRGRAGRARPDGSGYDLIIPDIARAVATSPTAAPSSTLTTRAAAGCQFYVSVINQDKPLPPDPFGLTNRPDELLHLVIDALERRA